MTHAFRLDEWLEREVRRRGGGTPVDGGRWILVEEGSYDVGMIANVVDDSLQGSGGCLRLCDADLHADLSRLNLGHDKMLILLDLHVRAFLECLEHVAAIRTDLVDLSLLVDNLNWHLQSVAHSCDEVDVLLQILTREETLQLKKIG